jgi:hypothetical protein
MRKEDLIPEYRFMDNFAQIYSDCSDQKTKDLLEEMRQLILYQMDQIREQRAQIIYVKHKYAWKHYDRDSKDYDTTKRKYIDKPDRTDTMGC